MKRLLLLVAMTLGWLAVALPVAAQGTPSAGEPLSEPATIYDNNAQPIGTVAALEITDPFTGYDRASSPPNRGYHWVMATVEFTAKENALQVSSGSFQLVDADGFAVSPSYIYRTEESTTENPDFSASEVPAGQSVSGAIFFQVFNDAKPVLLEYLPGYTQLIVVADLRGQTVDPGTAVAFDASDGLPLGTAAVTGVVDPLTDFDTSYPPQRGFHYVGVGITLTNSGDTPISVDPNRFSVVDHEGFLTSTAGAYRTTEGKTALPDLQYGTLDPGQSVSGLVTFLLINGSEIETVYYAPTSDRQIWIAEYAAGSTYVPPASSPVPTPDPACSDAIAWAQAASAALEPAGPVFDLLQSLSEGQTADAATLRASADTLRKAADDLAAVDTPAIVSDASQQFQDALNTMADQVDAIADAVESGDKAAISSGVEAVYTTAFGLTGGAYATLAEQCPSIQDVE